MSTAATTPAALDTLPFPTALLIPIAKVDTDKRLVRGVATAEVLDSQGQIVDYEAAKSAFSSWVGNIREMHQPKAVGKRTEVIFDDEKKEIILESYISKGAPDTWEKVVDGTLSMYSIGANGTVKVDKVAPKGRLFPTDLVETSLVDNGACPVAKFDIVKMVNGVPTDAQPEEPAEIVLSLRDVALTKMAALGDAPAAMVAKVREALARKIGYPETYDVQQALGCIACLQSLLASEIYDLRDLEMQGEDVATEAAQVATLRAAVELVLSFVMSEFAAQFDAPEPSPIALSRRAALVKAFEAALPITFGNLDSTGQLWLAKAGARHSKQDVAMIQGMHDTAISLGAKCTEPETTKIAVVPPTPPVAEAPAAPAAAEVPETPAAPVEKVAAPVAAVPAAGGVVEMQTLVESAVTKALETQKATSEQTIAALQARVLTLEAQPMPGGPVTRAVQKTFASAAPATEGADPTQVMAILTGLQKEATTDAERGRIAEAIVKHQMSTGANALAVRPHTWEPPPAATPAPPTA